MKEKIAIVTGAARGIGAAEARLFAQEGAKVVATDIRFELLQETVNQINNNGGEAIALKLDVSSEADWIEVIQKTIDTYGQLDVLMNNAGMGYYKTIEDTTVEEWSHTMNVNALGTFLGMKHALPHMKQTGGSIVNTSSVTGISGIGFAAYNASKGAVRSLTKNVAIEYAKYNIRINSIHPGVIETDFAAPVLADEASRQAFAAMTPLPSMGQPSDVAHVALFLASDESRFVTGAEYLVDGGLVAQ